MFTMQHNSSLCTWPVGSKAKFHTHIYIFMFAFPTFLTQKAYLYLVFHITFCVNSTPAHNVLYGNGYIMCPGLFGGSTRL